MTDDVPLELTVECCAGHRGEQEPRRFRVGGRFREVRTVLDRWLSPDHRYFKLLADDGAMYILRHDQGRSLWELTLFESRERLEGAATKEGLPP